MGKGDQRSKKGKVKAGSFGKTRNKRALKAKNSTTAKKPA
jgi:ribosomal small subunit protein bTHX